MLLFIEVWVYASYVEVYGVRLDASFGRYKSCSLPLSLSFFLRIFLSSILI